MLDQEVLQRLDRIEGMLAELLGSKQQAGLEPLQEARINDLARDMRQRGVVALQEHNARRKSRGASRTGRGSSPPPRSSTGS